MLGSYPVDVMLLATDLGVARSFYGDTLGLEVLLADTQFLTFGCGGDSRLVVTKSTTGTAEATTKASWRVGDLAGEVAELRARGVQLQDLPELGTVDGIADLGFALAAWFIDPHDNWIGLLQLKDPGVRPHGAATGATPAHVSDSPGAEPEASQHMAKAVGRPVTCDPSRSNTMSTHKPSSWAPAAAPGAPSDKEARDDDRSHDCRP